MMNKITRIVETKKTVMSPVFIVNPYAKSKILSVFSSDVVTVIFFVFFHRFHALHEGQSASAS
tara:strand:- start:560 stop:748 length:189 start_codon:yes stop_codon:yes gene_type:complete